MKPNPSKSTTFPIPLYFNSDVSSRATNAAAQSLNMLFLGPSHFSCDDTTHPANTTSLRAQDNLFNIITNIPSTNPDQNSIIEDQVADDLADLPSFQFFDTISHLFINPENAFERGMFQRIQADRIDLPTGRPPVNHELFSSWINRLPPEMQRAFTSNARAYFITPLLNFVAEGKRQQSLPIPRVHATTREYAKLLNKAEAAGMLHWDLVKYEEPQYSELANQLQLTLFAVSKSETRSKLISRPRVQNDGLPDVPYTSLPDPSMFQAVEVNGSASSSSYIDVSNMFHNITLPRWLARLFPLKPIPLALLSQDTISRIASRVNLSSCGSHDLLRPCQSSMPMGFKWSVYVGHTFTSSCLQQAFRIFKTSRLAPPSLANLVTLQRSNAPFIVTSDSPLLMHIIDDVTTLTIDWAPEAVKLWHRITRTILRANTLPIGENKYCPIDQIETQEVPFIGCIWNIKNMTVYPAPQKLAKVIRHKKNILSSDQTTVHEWQRLIGKLVWFAILNRPLLACLQHVFAYHSVTNPQQIIQINQQSKRELRMLAALLPLAQVQLKLQTTQLLVAFDASQAAGAVTWTMITQELAATIWKQAQHEKHNPPEPPRQTLPAVQQAVDEFEWKQAVTHYWHKQEHSNKLEASASILALEWLIRAGITKQKIVILTDSLVTLGALHKGRSSVPGLLVRCRRFGALALAHGLQVCLAYVRSESNPADKYTRLKIRSTQRT